VGRVRRKRLGRLVPINVYKYNRFWQFPYQYLTICTFFDRITKAGSHTLNTHGHFWNTRADDHIMALRLSLPPHPRTQHKPKQKVRMPVIMKLRRTNNVLDENLISYEDMMDLKDCMLGYTKSLNIHMYETIGSLEISDLFHRRKLSPKMKDNEERVFNPQNAMIDVAINTMMEYFSYGGVVSCTFKGKDKDDDTKESDEEDFKLERSIYNTVHAYCQAWRQMKIATDAVLQANKNARKKVGGKRKRDETDEETSL
jgi:hypothetical protein